MVLALPPKQPCGETACGRLQVLISHGNLLFRIKNGIHILDLSCFKKLKLQNRVVFFMNVAKTIHISES